MDNFKMSKIKILNIELKVKNKKKLIRSIIIPCIYFNVSDRI